MLFSQHSFPLNVFNIVNEMSASCMYFKCIMLEEGLICCCCFFILQRLINNVLHFIFISFVGTDVSAVRETRRNKSIDHFQLRYLFNKQPLSITCIILRLQRREASVLSSVLLEHPCIDKFIDKQVFHKKFTSI